MANKIVKETFGAPEKHILIANNSYMVTLPIKVEDSNEFIQPDENGRKIAKAGTPVAGDLLSRENPFWVTQEQDAKGILLHDVDITEGVNNATIVIAGCVDWLKLDEETKVRITPTIREALNKIIFVEGSAI